MWRLIKAAIREHGSRGDKVLPFLLKFRDIVERLGHHLMIERMVAISEAGLECRGPCMTQRDCKQVLVTEQLCVVPGVRWLGLEAGRGCRRGCS